MLLVQKPSWNHLGYWKELILHSEMIKDGGGWVLKRGQLQGDRLSRCCLLPLESGCGTGNMGRVKGQVTRGPRGDPIELWGIWCERREYVCSM